MTNENTNIELTDHTEANSNSSSNSNSNNNDHDDIEVDIVDSVPDGDTSDGGEQTDDSVDAEHYRDVEMRQFSAVSGFPADFGYRFPVTKPLGLVGVTVDDLRDGTEAMLYFDEPDAEQSVLTAALIR